MMLRSAFLAGAVSVLSGTYAWADARMSVLVDVLRLQEAAEILSAEGIAQSQDLNVEMLDGRGGAGWAMQVQHIYEPARMVELVRGELETALSGQPLEDVIAFYASPLGSEIVSLENTARLTMQDPDVEDAARQRYQTLSDEGDGRLNQVTELIESGDMISRNVTSAMNANYQFFVGLIDGKAIEMTEAEILEDVSRDLEESTADTTEWLSAYMLLAYHPLTDAQMQDYIAFSESEAGQALNRALFAGFGKAYEDISYALGRAVAINISAEEL